MSVSQRVIEREDFVEILKELQNIDPKTIAKVEEEKRKQAALTVAELAKLSEARSSIKQHEKSITDLEEEKKKLSEEKSHHENDVAAHVQYVQSHMQYVQSENVRLTEWENRLNGITIQQTESDKKMKEKVTDAENKVKQIEENHNEWERQYKEKFTAQIAVDVAQKREQERLNGEIKKLKDKAARLAAEAAKD